MLRELADQHAGLVDTFTLLRPHREWVADPQAGPRRHHWLGALRQWDFTGYEDTNDTD